MKRKIFKLLRSALIVATLVALQSRIWAQAKTASVKVLKDSTYQKISGFGGFVNSPQFGYNHMTEAEIRKLWGENSEAGYNIMRIYIPVGVANWPQSLATAQLAKSLGIKVFASPWSMPIEWKTQPVIGSRYQEVEGGPYLQVFLKEEHYEDYANYLNDYVTYLRDNGVELDAISLQNEPDYGVDYAGCVFTPAQMTKFIKEQGSKINCKVIAPETVGIPENYVNALNAADVLPHYAIFGGHQYGAIHSSLKRLQNSGKEVWMTEFLINWNQNGVSRDFSWTIDGFEFANRLNEAMLANINAWVHYASKRYYGMMGDGTFGTPTGVISKRGHIMSHYSKYVTGATRVRVNWNDNTSQLRGSSYISQDGRKVTVVVINPSANTYNLAVDLPFLSNSGKVVTTTEAVNMSEQAVSLAEETNRPKVTVAASSVTTIVFEKSGELTPSQMTGVLNYYDAIEKQTVQGSGFGTTYQLSGKSSVDFLGSTPLISTSTTSANYLKLNRTYNKLVFRVDNLNSTNLYSAGAATLHYINKNNQVSSKVYYSPGSTTHYVFDKRENFDWVLDISENVLTDGCIGILRITCNNGVSRLTFKFGDVYFATGSERGYTFSGPYSGTDGNLLDVLDDVSFTSLDFRNTTGVTAANNWRTSALNKNSVFYIPDGTGNSNPNVVADGVAADLRLLDGGGDFYPMVPFQATTATYDITLNGLRMLVLPFEANIPSGIKAYTLDYTGSKVKGTIIVNGKIPANTPVLVKGNGAFVFSGSGLIGSLPNARKQGFSGTEARVLQVGITDGVYIGVNAPIGGYVLTDNAGVGSFTRVTSASVPRINSFGAYLSTGLPTTAAGIELELDETALPVRLSKFTVQSTEGNVRLVWTTSSEVDNAGFSVERSKDGLTFSEIGFIKGNLNTEGEQLYTHTDYAPFAGTNYYRLKQLDTDGGHNYSPIRSIQLKGLSSVVRVYPNPVRDMVTVAWVGEQLGDDLMLFDALGRQVGKFQLNKDATDIKLSGLSTGVYFYRIGDFKGTLIKR